MIYEQQLTKILNPKGCGEQHGSMQTLDFYICGDTIMNTLCPKCKAIQQAQKETLLMCAKNELEFLEDWTLPTFNDTPERKYHNDRINTRISQLQEVIKRLEEMKCSKN